MARIDSDMSGIISTTTEKSSQIFVYSILLNNFYLEFVWLIARALLNIPNP